MIERSFVCFENTSIPINIHIQERIPMKLLNANVKVDFLVFCPTVNAL